MKVLLVTPAAELGGAERCLLDCVKALQAKAHEGVAVEVLSLAGGPLIEQIRGLGIKTSIVEPPLAIAELGESGARRVEAWGSLAQASPQIVGFLRRLRRSILAAEADVVHTNGMKAHLLAGTLAPRSARLVVHLHDFIGQRRSSSWLIPALNRVRRDTIFLANSHAVAADFARIAREARIRTVHNVVDTDYFSPGLSEPEWLARCAGLAPPEAECVSFGLVATYALWKGHELFIRAAGRVLTAYPRAPLRLYVVGGPIYQTLGSQVSPEDLKRWAQEAGLGSHFGIVGFQADIARVYRSLNVVVHASTEPEPFGRTIVEGMACGRPVLVASAGGAVELFQHGKNALGFSSGSETALAHAMEAVLEQSARERLGHEGRAHALANFGPARLPAELLAAYRPH